MTQKYKIGLIGLALVFLAGGVSVFAFTKRNIEIKTTNITQDDEMPSYPGGQDAMNKFIASSLRKTDGMSGKGVVTLRFVVIKTGEISNIKVMKSAGSECDAEATRVVQSMPKWEPAKQNDEAVDSYYTLCITF